MLWEYRIMSLPTQKEVKETQEALNGLGDNGWELVSAYPNQDLVNYLRSSSSLIAPRRLTMARFLRSNRVDELDEPLKQKLSAISSRQIRAPVSGHLWDRAAWIEPHTSISPSRTCTVATTGSMVA